MKHKFLILLGICAISQFSSAQDIAVQPHPQQITSTGKNIPLPSTFRIIGAEEANPQAVELLKALIGKRIDTKGYPIYIGEKNDKSVRKYKKLIPEKAEGYYLTIDDRQITLAGNDERGTFYAIQTLGQLVRALPSTDSLRNEIPVVEIKDYPDIRFRGVVEGFYGTPWSHEARLRQLKFYGENKLNTYIYGPKDDPYHSTPNWRLPYPTKEAEQIKELIRTAKENQVDFVWAIHPGQDIQWTDEDRDRLIGKFENMYQLGVRSFAIFFDDISGQGTDANRQAELLNYLDNQFVKVKKDVTPLIMCPTEYNKSWSNPKGNYLTTLGTKLNPTVQIMWTGDRVISDMTREGLSWINERIRRPAYIWWNFPVSDYVRDHLLMGEVYGNEKGIKDAMSGFVSNPMEHAESSKVALYGVADYTWNMEKYDSRNAWEQAMKVILPDASNALLTFCKHNSDLGQNGHSYRRDESVDIQPIVKRFQEAFLANGNYDPKDFAVLQNEFNQITASADILLTSKSNPALINEMKPWIHCFRYLGDTGNEVFNLIAAQSKGDKASFEAKYAHIKALQQLSYEAEQTYNQNPYQPGIKVGSKILQPLIDQLFTSATNRFNTAYGTQLNAISNYSPHKLTSNVEQLRNQPLQTKGRTILISPLLEVVKWPAGGFVEIEFDKAYNAFDLDMNFGSKELPTWGKLEVSADEKTWQTIEFSKGKKEMPIKAIRFSNASDKEEQTHLRRFAVTLK